MHSLPAGASPRRIVPAADWARLVLALVVVFALFHWLAMALGSDRGQSGILVGTLVVVATAVAGWALLDRPLGDALRDLGLGWPYPRSLIAAGGIAILVLGVGLMFVKARGAMVTLFPGTFGLLPGLFMQGGVAEEVLFRAFLFGHIRVGRTFWRAATLSMLPFLGAHLVLFFYMPWLIALSAILLAIVISFPFAYAFELGGQTIWAPALLHFVIQSTVKVFVLSNGAELFPIVWMIASGLVPLAIFLVPRR